MIKFTFKPRHQQLLLAAFPFLYVTTNLLLFLETVTYRGFVAKYLFIDARIFFYLTIGVMFFLSAREIFLHAKPAKTAEATRFVITANRLMLIPMLLIYYFLITLEVSNYPNYIYSHFHINPENLLRIVVLNIVIFMIELARTGKISSEINVLLHKWFGMRVGKIVFVQIAFFASCCLFLIPNMQYVLNAIYLNSIRTIQSLGESYDQKMVLALGGAKFTGWIYTYSLFLKKNTAENAIIFIPPQTEPWDMEGNQYYFRWFIYPRNIVTSQEIDAPIPDEAQYVLIADGAWVWGEQKYGFGWPRISIPAEKIHRILLIDRNTDQVTEKKDTAYAWDKNAHLWGLIELKK